MAKNHMAWPRCCVGLAAVLVTAGWAAKKPAPDLHLKLSNGLRLRVLRRRGAPVASLALRVQAGSREDARGEAGVAHVVARWVFGAAPPETLAVYGRPRYRVGPDAAWASQTVALSALPDLLRRAAQWLRAPAAAGFAPARAAVFARERRQWQLPYARLLRVGLPLAIFPRWADRHAGWGNSFDLSHLTADEGLAFFQRYYVPANAVAVIVTSGRRLPALREAEQIFRVLPGKPRPSRPPIRLPRLVKERQFSMHDPAAHWPALAIAWPGPRRRNRGYPAAAVLGWMLFHGSNSRAAMAMVDRRHAALEVSGGLGFPFTSWRAYQSPGVMGALAVYPPENHSALIEALIFREIHEISVNGITGNDLAWAQSGMAAAWWRARQTSGGLARQWARVKNSRKHLGLLRILRVQPRDVIRVDQQYLIHSRTTLLVDVPTPGVYATHLPQPPPAATLAPAIISGPPPAPSPRIPDYSPPRPDTDQFPNGLRIRIVRLPGVPLAAVRLAVKGGKAYQASHGLAAADAALMAANGAPCAARAGVRLRVRAGYDKATISLSGLASALPRMLQCAANLARHPQFSAAAAAPAQLPALTHPLQLGRALLAREIFRGTPYGSRPGGARALTPAQLLAFHRSVWLPNNHGVLVIAGEVSRSAAHNWAQKYFGGWPFGYPPRPRWKTPAYSNGLRLILVNRPQARRVVAMLGMPGPSRGDPGFRALLVATRAAQSQLRRRLGFRRKALHAYCDPLGHAGAWITEMRLPSAGAPAQLRQIVTMLSAGSGPWSPAGLQWAGRQLAARFLVGTQSAAALANKLLVPAMFSTPLSYLSTYIHRIQSVTPERAAKAWRRYVRPDQATLVVVGNAARLRPELARLMPGEQLVIWHSPAQRALPVAIQSH